MPQGERTDLRPDAIKRSKIGWMLRDDLIAWVRQEARRRGPDVSERSVIEGAVERERERVEREEGAA